LLPATIHLSGLATVSQTPQPTRFFHRISRRHGASSGPAGRLARGRRVLLMRPCQRHGPL